MSTLPPRPIEQLDSNINTSADADPGEAYRKQQLAGVQASTNVAAQSEDTETAVDDYDDEIEGLSEKDEGTAKDPSEIAQAVSPPQYPSKLEAALDHARNNFSIIPLRPNTKISAVDNWPYRATTGEAQIRRWWTKNPDYNIGGVTSGKLVVDIDSSEHGSHEVLGKAIDELKREVGPLPDTQVSLTQGGGAHLIYDAPPRTSVRNSVSKIMPGVDVRGTGGYIVLPGSTIDGRPYRWLDGYSPKDKARAQAPEALIAKCKERTPKSTAAGKRLVEEDDDAIALATKWLEEKAQEAVEGERNHKAYTVAATLYDFGVSKATALDLLLGWNEKHCSPPLDLDECKQIVESAGRNRAKPIGISHPNNASGFEPVEISDRETESESTSSDEEQEFGEDTRAPQQCRTLPYLTFAEAVAKAFEPGKEPLIEDVMGQGTLVITYGESGIGKSFTSMHRDIHVATGLAWAGHEVKQGAVVWVAAEMSDDLYRRIAALKQHFRLKGDLPFFTVPCPVNLRDPTADVGPLINLIRSIEEKHGVNVRKVTIDTLSRVIAGGDENSSVDMGRLVQHFDAIRSAVGVTVEVIHHSGKNAAKGARGHSLLRAATDTEFEVTRGNIEATKQRAMPSGTQWKFMLRSIRLDQLSKDGRQLTTRYADIRQNSASSFERMDLTGDEKVAFDALRAKVQASASKTGQAWSEVPFDWKLVSECMGKSAGKGGSRSNVQRLLTALTQKGWVKKVGRGQWVILDCPECPE